MPAIAIDGKMVVFSVEGDSIVADGRRITFRLLRESEGRLLVKIGDSVEEIVYTGNGREVYLATAKGPRKLEVLSDRDLLLKSLGAGSSAADAHSEVRAPMPGLVVRTMVKEGDSVKRGAKLVILEAMKMENEIRTPVDAVVGALLVKNGDIVEKDQVIVTLR
jgi:biotin carboxyl carrier protein